MTTVFPVINRSIVSENKAISTLGTSVRLHDRNDYSTNHKLKAHRSMYVQAPQLFDQSPHTTQHFLRAQLQPFSVNFFQNQNPDAAVWVNNSIKNGSLQVSFGRLERSCGADRVRRVEGPKWILWNPALIPIHERNRRPDLYNSLPLLPAVPQTPVPKLRSQLANPLLDINSEKDKYVLYFNENFKGPCLSMQWWRVSLNAISGPLVISVAI